LRRSLSLAGARKKLESFGVTHKRGKKPRDERALDD